MTGHEFMARIRDDHYSGKTLLATAKRRYKAYVEAYQQKSLESLVYYGRLSRSNFKAVVQAARDRDCGRSMAVCPELME